MQYGRRSRVFRVVRTKLINTVSLGTGATSVSATFETVAAIHIQMIQRCAPSRLILNNMRAKRVTSDYRTTRVAAELAGRRTTVVLDSSTKLLRRLRSRSRSLLFSNSFIASVVSSNRKLKIRCHIGTMS